jgi:SAM-dependent methyltransferase
MSIKKLLRQIPDKIKQHNLKKRIGEKWLAPSEKIIKRHYANYENYIEHQQAKLSFKSICPIDLVDYDARYSKILYERLKSSNLIHGGSALCLGARQGTEVKSFLDCGCFAVGIDLNPGKNNLLVLPGDFHQIQFPDNSIDIVFSNSIDHVFDINKLLMEIVRILKIGGLFITEVGRGKNEGGSVSFYESLTWTTLDELVALIIKKGFKIALRQQIDFPFPGESIFFLRI